MARVWIPLVGAELGGLPAVCARTGTPAERFVALTARARAGWTWFLLPLGVLPFLAARHLAPRVTLLIPLSHKAVRRVDRLRLGRLLTLFGAVVVAAAAVAVHRRETLLAALGSLIGSAVLGTLEAAFSVRAWFDPSARGVLLAGVHPAFRDAVDQVQRAAWTRIATEDCIDG